MGLHAESELLYVKTTAGQVLALDLAGGRADTVATAVEQAALGPDGTLYTVDKTRKVVSLTRRTRFAWPRALTGAPTDLFAATDQRLVAVLRQDPPRVVTAAPDQPPVTKDIALTGDVAASYWGDALAAVSDSGVVILDPFGQRGPTFVPIIDHPRALAFSPSGHRIFVAKRAGTGLAVIDRYERKEIDGIALPGPAATIRLDPYGRWLLARPALSDSVWVVEVPIKSWKGGLATSWEVDLPTVAPGGTLLARRGDDVVAYRVDSLRETGRVDGGAADLWVVTTWTPGGGARAAFAATSQAQAEEAGTGAGEGVMYVQVSVSRNEAWSQEMAGQLQRAGLAARVLPPPADRPDDGYRVVLGPYATRAEAEAIGRKLGRPYWIYQPEP